MSDRYLSMGSDGWNAFNSVCAALVSHFHEVVVQPAERVVQGASRCNEVRSFKQDGHAWKECSGNRDHDGRFMVPETVWPFLKLAIIQQRRAVATVIDERFEKTLNPEIRKNLQSSLALFDKWTSEDWFIETNVRPLPRLAALLSLEEAERVIRDERLVEDLKPRQHDEKFHILLSPSLFLPDLQYYRTMCELRGRSIAVAFVDIDDFKRFNTAYSESHVDLHLLPVFMTSIEQHVFAHGHAYRAGGEEYLVLLPNVSEREAIGTLNELRKTLKTLEYPEVDGNTAVSIGLCVADVDCFLTNREIMSMANKAKGFAKKNGKDCVVSYKSDLFRTEDLYVAASDQ